MSEENPNTEKSVDEARPVAPVQEPNPAEVQRRESARRLRELLAIPERDRSDEIWDEIVNLEIQLAPGNRAVSPQSESGRRQDTGQRQDPRQQKNAGRRQRSGRRPETQGRGPEQRVGAKPGKRFFKKSRRGGGTGSSQ